DSGGRVFGKVSSVDSVDCCKFLNRRAIHIAFEDVLQRRPRRLEAKFHLLQNKFGLALDWRFNHFSGAGIEWRKPGDVDHIAASSTRYQFFGGRRTLRRRTAGVSHRPRSQSKSVRARSILGLDPWVGPAQGMIRRYLKNEARSNRSSRSSLRSVPVVSRKLAQKFNIRGILARSVRSEERRV